MTFQAPITIKTALDRMHRHDYVLPAIQREFVWDQDRIVRLFDSLMRGYPIGSFLFWNIEPKQAADYTYYNFSGRANPAPTPPPEQTRPPAPHPT